MQGIALVLAMLVLMGGCSSDKKQPTTSAPTTNEQTTNAPTTKESTTEATTQEPTTQEPTTQEPTAQESTTQESTATPTAPPQKVWDDYKLEFHDYANISETENLDVRIKLPVIIVKDAAQMKYLNDECLAPGALLNYGNYYVLENFRMNIDTRLTKQDDVISYIFQGTSTRPLTDEDRKNGRYEPYEKDRVTVIRYGFTMERTTGKAINIEEAIGMDVVTQAISSGAYEFVENPNQIQNIYSNEDLAYIYENFPSVRFDLNHEKDFYIENGFVNVIIDVGEENGSFAILKILAPSKL